MVLLSILAILIAFYFYQKNIPSQIEVQVNRNTLILSNYDFIYEHWKEEKLLTLRERENYKDIPAKTQFKYFLKLCNWTHNQWERSIPDPYPLSNALDIFTDIRSGKTGGFCGQYAYVLADIMKSVGFFAVRYVELWSNTGGSHFVVEVWCDQYEKWVVLDPDNNIYYELADSKIPANAYEIRSSLFTERQVITRSADNPEISLETQGIKLYANFAVSLRSDLLRHPKPLKIQDRFHMFLFFKDDHTNEEIFEGKNPYFHITTRLEDIYYDCNRVRVEYQVNHDDKSVFFTFFTDQTMANFKFFLISLDQGEHWEISYGTYVIKGEGIVGDLWVTPVNMYDRKGCITQIKIFLD